MLGSPRAVNAKGELAQIPGSKVTLSGKLAGRVGKSWTLGSSAIWGLLQPHTFPHTILCGVLFYGVLVGKFFFRDRICSWVLPFPRLASRLSAHAGSRLHISAGCHAFTCSSPSLFWLRAELLSSMRQWVHDYRPPILPSGNVGVDNARGWGKREEHGSQLPVE